MQVNSSLASLAAKALAESLDLGTMTMVARMLIQSYDINRSTGFPENIPVPRKNAAQQIVADIKKAKLFLQLIQHLIDIHSNGYMGRKYPIKYLRQIIMEMREQGIIYDQENKIFVEDPAVRRTRNWGALMDDEDYTFAFLRLDIVGNTALVRKYSEDIIQSTYGDLRSMVQSAIDKRNGRIWNWEGDGGLVAFFFSNKNLYATVSGMDIVHRLFLYNQLQCRLDKPLGVRLAVHGGRMSYSDNEEELKRSDVIKKVMDIESKFTNPNTLTISDAVATTLDKNIMDAFHPVKVDDRTNYFNYGLRWEQ